MRGSSEPCAGPPARRHRRGAPGRARRGGGGRPRVCGAARLVRGRAQARGATLGAGHRGRLLSLFEPARAAPGRGGGGARARRPARGRPPGPRGARGRHVPLAVPRVRLRSRGGAQLLRGHGRAPGALRRAVLHGLVAHPRRLSVERLQHEGHRGRHPRPPPHGELPLGPHPRAHGARPRPQRAPRAPGRGHQGVPHPGAGTAPLIRAPLWAVALGHAADFLNRIGGKGRSCDAALGLSPTGAANAADSCLHGALAPYRPLTRVYVPLLAALALAFALAPVARADVKPRIVNGTGVNVTDVPFQALLFEAGTSPVSTGPTDGGGRFCGGVVTDATHVITAAHCVFDVFRAGQVSNPSDVEVLAGTDDLSSPDLSEQTATATQIAFDPLYDPSTNVH